MKCVSVVLCSHSELSKVNTMFFNPGEVHVHTYEGKVLRIIVLVYILCMGLRFLPNFKFFPNNVHIAEPTFCRTCKLLKRHIVELLSCT
jgi:hypothetical protein